MRHAIHVLGSRILSFSQDLYDDSGDPSPEQAQAQARTLAVTNHPRLAELAAAATHDGALGGYDDDQEFVFAIDLILDGLDRRRALQTPERA